jgi:uncharacterized membrane protein YdjX (TVP38/TMEM64 family)
MRTADDMTVPGRQATRTLSLEPGLWRRLIPLLLVVVCLLLAWLVGLTDYLSLSSIAAHRDSLQDFVAGHRALAIAVYMLAYIVATALVLPGAALLTVLGGFLFGWWVGGIATVLAATVGATLLFSVARSSFGDVLVRRGKGFVRKLTCGFEEDAFSYLLFLRLVPLFPFFIVNIATALCRVKVRTFVIATFLGIIPGTFAYATLGSGLDSIIAAEARSYAACTALNGAAGCSLEVGAASLLTPQMIAAFLLLGLVALIPPLLKRFKAARPS